MHGGKIRVLIIPAPEPADAVTSGIGRYVGILESHYGSEVEVFHLPGTPHQEDRQLLRPIDSAYTGKCGSSWVSRALVPQFIRLLAGYVSDIIRLSRKLRPFRKKVDLIHLNRVGCEIQTIAARLAGFRHVVTTIHNLPGEDRAAQYWVRRLVERLSFTCAGRLIAVSATTYEAWRDRIGLRAGRVAVIHNGMDVKEILPSREEARRRYDIPENITVFGICARLHPMKGHMVLLEAFAQLLRSRMQDSRCRILDANCLIPGAGDNSLPSSGMSEPASCVQHPVSLLLLIAGDGPEEERIRARINELGLAGHVRLLGRVQDVLGFMRALDVHVLPSVTLESMPFSVVEAMFAGTPSLVSDVGGAQEVIVASDSGAVVPRNNAAALAACLYDWVCDLQRCRAAGARGTAYARKHLTGAEMARATLDVYRKAL